MATSQTDVVVVGGGPAGSTVASFLARKGHSVTVFEKEVFPRDHVGESMLPFCYHIFKELGVLEEMEDRFVRKPGVRFLDTDGVTSTTFCFGHKIEGPSHLSFQVIRAEMDELLLDHSADEGAEVFEGASVREVDLAGPAGAAVVRFTGRDGGESEITTRFVIDASGRSTFLANRMKTKTAHKELERTAIHAHWTNTRYLGGLQEGMIQIVYTGGEKQGWIWVIPLGRDRLSVGLVMNTSFYQSQRRRLKDEGISDWKQELYLREVMLSPFVQEVLHEAEQMMGVTVEGDYSYTVDSKWGHNYALVGDASAFIDPIFSSGVYLAMQSARDLSEAVDIRLSKGVEAGAEAMTQTYDRIVGAYALVDKLIRLFYTPNVLNFAQLGSAADAFEDYDHYANAIGLQHFLLAGDFFEQANKYSDFVDGLRDPRYFDMYQNLVMKRPSFQADGSCGMSPAAIFPPKLAEHEARRAALGI
ncbi:MAG TPA: NAD(P)/FAD-dependent oxidoreductase [Acidimicrobiia bacterium]|nr:NAD(P)/FAD-dependent oxidoreductase [Acidimicrobiia bacterium]